MKSGTDHVFDMTPDEYCQQKAAASGSSFYYSFLFLSPKRRRAITALYAFCREVDDVVDETSDPQVAGAKLAWRRAEIANLAAGKAQHPVSLALAPFVEKFGIPGNNAGIKWPSGLGKTLRFSNGAGYSPACINLSE